MNISLQLKSYKNTGAFLLETFQTDLDESNLKLEVALGASRSKSIDLKRKEREMRGDHLELKATRKHRGISQPHRKD
jgi:hypothetical protein